MHVCFIGHLSLVGMLLMVMLMDKWVIGCVSFTVKLNRAKLFIHAATICIDQPAQHASTRDMGGQSAEKGKQREAVLPCGGIEINISPSNQLHQLIQRWIIEYFHKSNLFPNLYFLRLLQQHQYLWNMIMEKNQRLPSMFLGDMLWGPLILGPMEPLLQGLAALQLCTCLRRVSSYCRQQAQCL